LDGRGSVCAARLEIQSSSSLKLSTMNATTKIPHDTRESSRDAIIPCKCSLGFLPFFANKDFNPEDSASDLSLLDFSRSKNRRGDRRPFRHLGGWLFLKGARPRGLNPEGGRRSQLRTPKANSYPWREGIAHYGERRRRGEGQLLRGTMGHSLEGLGPGLGPVGQGYHRERKRERRGGKRDRRASRGSLNATLTRTGGALLLQGQEFNTRMFKCPRHTYDTSAQRGAMPHYGKIRI